LGNDGNIGLPYWDWTDEGGPSGNEPYPNILLDPRLSKLPDGFWKEEPPKELLVPSNGIKIFYNN
jgi:hypothetical protein